MSTELLEGAVDLHVHSSPDVRPRYADSWASAEMAAAAGMAGIALKNHQYGTAPVVRIVQPRVPGVRLFSYLVLNTPVGGLNLAAVRVALDLGVDIVSLPTIESSHHLASSGRDPARGIAVSRDGELLPEARAIIEEVVARDRVLATGHSAAEDSLLAVRYAHRLGATRLLVTHATSWRISMPVAMQVEAARLGAMIEHAYESTTEQMEHPVAISEIAEQVAAVGPEHCVLTTDFARPTTRRSSPAWPRSPRS